MVRSGTATGLIPDTRSGGSLSHHGVGKLREQFLPRIASAGTLAWSDAVKQAVDPLNVFGIGNQRTDAQG